MANKIDSNVTGLRYAEEESIKVLPEFTPVIAATGTLTFGGTGEEDDTITIGSRVYTLRDTFDSDVDEVIIGTTAAETAQRLADAINNGSTGANAAYVGAGTSANTDVTATVQGSVITLTAIVPGTAGNSVATTETSDHATFGAATLEGGADAVGNPPTWWPLEPNSYSDFGGQITTIARNPINPSRQRKKGVTTDLDASGGFAQDLTQTGLTRLLQGFFFADIREKATTAPMNAAAVALTGVTAADDTYAAAAGLDIFEAGDLILASGFSQAANNGLKQVVISTSGTVVVGDGLVNETPGADAKLQHVGFQFGSSELDIVVSGSYPRLVRSSGTKDLTTFGLIPGEWVFIGGDATATKFTNAANNGFARVREVAATYIEFDKTAGTMVAETGTGKTIQLFFGNVLKNEKAANLIKRRSYQLERTLGQDGDGTMSEYLLGAVPNELSLQIRQADKVTVELGFVAVDNEQRDGSAGVKSGTRPDLVEAPAFNTSSDFSRIKMHLITAGDTNPDPLFAFLTELTLTINNNVSPNKAVAVLGAFDVSAGTFAVSGNVTAYFADIAAVQAVRNNADVALDFALVKNNAGMVWDIPLIALGEGRLNVEQDQPITLPLSVDAAEGRDGHTLLFNEFPYLPNAADV